MSGKRIVLCLHVPCGHLMNLDFHIANVTAYFKTHLAYGYGQQAYKLSTGHDCTMV